MGALATDAKASATVPVSRIFTRKKKRLGKCPTSVDASASDSSDDSIFDDGSVEDEFSVLSFSTDPINSWYVVFDGASTVGSQLSGEKGLLIGDDVYSTIDMRDGDVPLKPAESYSSHLAYQLPNASKNPTDGKERKFYPGWQPICFPRYLEDIHVSDFPMYEEKFYSSPICEPDISNDSTDLEKYECCSSFEPLCFRGYFEELPTNLQHFHPKKQGVDIPVCMLDESVSNQSKRSSRVRFATVDDVDRVPIWARRGWRYPPSPGPIPSRGILRKEGSSRNRKGEMPYQVSSGELAPVIRDEQTGTHTASNACDDDSMRSLPKETDVIASKYQNGLLETKLYEKSVRKQDKNGQLLEYNPHDRAQLCGQLKPLVDFNPHKEPDSNVYFSSASSAAPPISQDTGSSQGGKHSKSRAGEESSTEERKSGGFLSRVFAPKLRRYLPTMRTMRTKEGRAHTIPFFGISFHEPARSISDISEHFNADPSKHVNKDVLYNGLALAPLESFEEMNHGPGSFSHELGSCLVDETPQENRGGLRVHANGKSDFGSWVPRFASSSPPKRLIALHPPTAFAAQKADLQQRPGPAEQTEQDEISWYAFGKVDAHGFPVS